MKIKKLLSALIPGVPVALVLGMMIFSPSCANTTQAPSGGKKDTIPPVIVGIRPLPGATGVPVNNARISFTFNEYVTVKEPKNIFLSPPQARQPRYRLRGKTLTVWFENDLEENTTYTLDLSGALADNNEGNMYPGYTYTFSTGDRIDSMVVTGTVLDCNTLEPVKGATVLLYRDLADSAVYSRRPDAAVKTDEWGYFALRNVADADFRLYAIQDEAGNNLYDADADKLAFIDSVLRPKLVASDTLAEILKYDMKDTVHVLARRAEHELYLFRDQTSKQMVLNKERTGDRTAYLTFMAPDAKIDSLWVRGIPAKNLIMQFNDQRDSLEIWINDRRRMPDTLHVFVDYLKTDTLGTLSPFTEHLRLPRANANVSRSAVRRNLRHEDTLCVLKASAEPETVEQYGFRIEFNQPLINAAFDSLVMRSVNPRQQEARMNYRVERDTANVRVYNVYPEETLQTGYEYFLKIPHRKFRDINGFWNDSTEVKVSLPRDDKLSTLNLDLQGVANKYIVDLLGEKRDKVLRSFTVESDKILTFPYLKSGKYSIRLTEDLNRNGRVDTGNYSEHRQPEKVKFYKLKDGTFLINVPESTEMDQTIDVAKLFEN